MWRRADSEDCSTMQRVLLGERGKSQALGVLVDEEARGCGLGAFDLELQATRRERVETRSGAKLALSQGAKTFSHLKSSFFSSGGQE